MAFKYFDARAASTRDYPKVTVTRINFYLFVLFETGRKAPLSIIVEPKYFYGFAALIGEGDGVRRAVVT